MSSGWKRKRLILEDDEDEVEKFYDFKVLLPNGTTVSLTLRNPAPEITMDDFVKLVREKYMETRISTGLSGPKRQIDWDGGEFCLMDTNDNSMRKLIRFEIFNSCRFNIVRLLDGSGEVVETFENMWDLTPDTDLLKELPEDYTFETALADLIDNSLQAVWSNGEDERRLISVDILDDRISIFDTGSGMDGSDGNSIAKWGKMGASLHRSSKAQAIGGKPPYLMPYFGMFGYGGPIASMHLGKCALVSSKTKESKKVYRLFLERETLLSRTSPGVAWKTEGGLRNPSAEEIRLSPHESFTKVEIFEPRFKNLDLDELRCKLKDIYFPYIQCDEVSKIGKTERPIAFQVNGVDLTEVEGGEVAITNLHSCNGREFSFQLRFTLHQNKNKGGATQQANARLKFVYLPIVEGKETTERILEILEAQQHRDSGSYAVFCPVSVRRLGRLLPDVRWAFLPFMDLRRRKGARGQILKSCSNRVKCFIDTDAGFHPTPSKTDLAPKNPFSLALKCFGGKLMEKEQDVTIQIHRSGEPMYYSQLEKEYLDWILEMHDGYDEEVESGEDQPVVICSPPNKKELGISTDVFRVHECLKRKGVRWKRGQNIKILKGACAGCHRNDIYATLEYFLIEGFPGDGGGKARFICRPLDQPNDKGCNLSIENGIPSLDIRNSLSIPISVIDSEKCLAVGINEWETKLKKQDLKAPSQIQVLNEKLCSELNFDGALPIDSTVSAGHVPPSVVVAVLRPASFTSNHTSKSLDQKYIVKDDQEMYLEINFSNDAENSKKPKNHIYSGNVAPSSVKEIHGLYIFPIGSTCPKLFQKAGIYRFSFSFGNSIKCVETVIVEALSEVAEWRLLTVTSSSSVRVGSCFPHCHIACYDRHDNQIPFPSLPNLAVELNGENGFHVQIDRAEGKFIYEQLILKIEGMLIQTSDLDRIRPSYKATLRFGQKDGILSVSVPCRVKPGHLKRIVSRPHALESLLPGVIVDNFSLEVFDDYDNHLSQDTEIEINVDGFDLQDRMGSTRKVNDQGFIELSGLLKVTAGYGKSASLSVLCGNKEIFKQNFLIVQRELRVVSEVPMNCEAGSTLKNIVFEVTDANGTVDATIHDDEKSGQFHTLTITSESLDANCLIKYAFQHGRCVVPSLSLPENEEICTFEAFHSRHRELKMTFKVSLLRATDDESYGCQTPSPGSRNELHLTEASPASINHQANMMYFHKHSEVLEEKVKKLGLRIGRYEQKLETLKSQKEELEQGILKSQVALAPQIVEFVDCLSTKEGVMKQIEVYHSDSAASVFCSIHRENVLQDRTFQARLRKDVLGLVVLLGTVSSTSLSRVLSEYLGTEQMLALVCNSFEAACNLEQYEQTGDIDSYSGLHAEAASLGKSITGRFVVKCLETIRTIYAGQFVKNDPQRRLDLPIPTSPSGGILPGFQGYAVNMVDLDPDHLKIRTSAGYGLRETLFYSLFGKLQIYDTRNHLQEALPYINHGAASLDGGIIRENGSISLGHRNPEVCFPVTATGESLEIIRQIEANIEGIRTVNKQIVATTDSHRKVREKISREKEKYKSFIEGYSPLYKQHLLEYARPPLELEDNE